MTCRSTNCSNSASPARQQGYCDKHYQRIPHGFVDATQSIEHVRALRNAGYSLRTLAAMTGLEADTMALLGAWTPHSRVTLNTHQKIMAIPLPVGIVDGGAQHVPNVGTKRRIQALLAAGYSLQHLADELGVSMQAVHFGLRNKTVYSTTAVRVRDLFDRLQMTPGPSKRARNAALRKGYAPPLAWDEDTIDDPNAGPQMPKGDKSDWYEDYLELKELNLSDKQIAERFGIRKDTLTQRLARMEAA